ncbi:hypothetical protein F511_42335 [Dorcoceras hygrometricum]|uniref:Uncharacterized protein n=1 Tax=Dorcoceras hygrometricum TaxID=472368 RepID=A0A2Z7D4H8_9LAMI|nr:hypothetical protein F511_42335 [Dorcoceras hygrometricum]
MRREVKEMKRRRADDSADGFALRTSRTSIILARITHAYNSAHKHRTNNWYQSRLFLN